MFWKVSPQIVGSLCVSVTTALRGNLIKSAKPAGSDGLSSCHAPLAAGGVTSLTEDSLIETRP